MNFLVNGIQKEKQHFLLLHDQTQHLLISILLYALISPLFGLFINAFLWRESQSIVVVALYNLIKFCLVPIGFYINGYLLKKFTTNKLYLIGLLLQAINTASLIFFPAFTPLTVGIFGCLQGLAIGIYWGNRNLLTLQTTKSDNRIYFSGIEITASTVTGIAIPFLIGVFITAGTAISLYTPLVAYKILAIIMLLISVVIGQHILDLKETNTPFTTLWIHSANPRWKRFRLYQLCYGFLDGTTTFIPAITVLLFIGNERALGTIQSISAILAAFIVYYLSKKLVVKQRMQLVTASIAIGVGGAILFSVFFSALGVSLFFVLTTMCVPILWMPYSSLNYDLIDEDGAKEKHYAYVCDQEISLNFGRMLAINLWC